MPIDPNKVKWDDDQAIDPETVKWDNETSTGETKPDAPAWFLKKFTLPEKELAEQKVSAERNQQTLLTAVKNTPESAYRLAENIWNAVRHPVDTAESVYKTAKGGVDKLQRTTDDRSDDENKFDSMMDFFKERYGGEDAIRNTIEKDPAGFLADVSSVLSGTGGVVRGGAAIASKVGPTAAKIAAPVAAAGKAATSAGAALDPLSLAVTTPINALGKLVPKTGRLSPESLLESAMKPSTALPYEERMSRAATALEHGIMPTRGGLDKVRDLISQIDEEMAGIIKTSQYKGNPVSTQNVVGYLDELKDFALNTVNPKEALSKIGSVEKKFVDAWGPGMSLQAAHQLKKNTYVELKKFYDQFQRSAVIEAKKAIARGLKEEVYALHPELRGLGKQEGALISLEESIERAVNRISNRDVLGIGVPIKGATGAAVAGAPGAIATTVIGIMDTPVIKAQIAHALNKARSGMRPIRGGGLRGAAFQSGRIDHEVDQVQP